MNKICALDIDGVLNYYPDCWIEFVNKKLGTNFTNLNEMKEKLSYKVYKDFKHEYRVGSYKLGLRARDGVQFLTRLLKNSNYDIIILTSRPFDSYPHLRILTHNWLNANNIIYDDLFFSNTKHLDILQFYPNLKFMIEDNRSFANKIGALGYLVFLMDNPYNVGEINENVKRVSSLNKEQIKIMEEILCQRIRA